MSNHENYTIGWICAISTEAIAARVFLDEEHGVPDYQHPQDDNSYTLGRIGRHNVVIAVLPNGQYGISSATGVFKDMLRSFPRIKVGLMVGIGGGAPSRKHDIRLGDIVVSTPSNGESGVLQYDFGKVIQNQSFKITGALNNPPTFLLTAVSTLKSRYECDGHSLEEAINHALQKKPRLRKKYSRPDDNTDRLYLSNITHPPNNDTSCIVACSTNPSKLIIRSPRAIDDDNPMIHYGLIASANQVMKDASIRDELVTNYDVLCFEMEAAGLVNQFPCLVIRGICDYSDSHKNKGWQGYAAMAATAYTKDLLYQIPPTKVEAEKAISDILSPVINEIKSLNELEQKSLDQRENHFRQQNLRTFTKDQQECHQGFKTSTYEQFKNINPPRVEGTCEWVLKNTQYLRWWESNCNDLLWISADPGCGKSVLARSLIDEDFKKFASASTTSICYFFFKDNDEQNNLATALCAILHQLFGLQPDLLRYALPSWEKNREKLQHEVDELWRILIAATSDPKSSGTICIFDALDECCITSRPYDEIQKWFQTVTKYFPHIHLRGEKENDQIHKEISLVVKIQVKGLADQLALSDETRLRVERQLLQMKHRTYLWLYLAIDDIYETLRDSIRRNETPIELVPDSVYEAYKKILNKVPPKRVEYVKKILHIIVGARRPLTIQEMAMALGVATSNNPQTAAKAGLISGEVKEMIPQLCGLFVFINNERVFLIHQTAREFLIQNIAGKSNCIWHFGPSDAENIMAQICVRYLLLNDLADSATKSGSNINILLSYSAENWADHVRKTPKQSKFELDGFLNKLYDVSTPLFGLWFPIFWRATMGYNMQPRINAIHLAAFNGHGDTITRLINESEININQPDSNGNNALLYGSLLGYYEVVQVLLEKGANVNAQGGKYGNALQVASRGGYDKIVQILLEKGANVNAQGGKYSNVLYIASKGGHDKIVRILLEKGANVNAQGGEYGNALQAASKRGYDKIVQILLRKGANVNAQGGEYGNALQAASKGGHTKIVQILLEKGANVNAQSSFYGNALYTASGKGHHKIVQILLEKGANVNAQGGEYGNALQAASEGGHDKIVQILLEKGANVNAQGGEYGNALQAASEGGYDKIVQILLEKGANVNAQGGFYSNALQAASKGGHSKIVQILLEKGADIYAQGGFYSNALQAASGGGHDKIVQILLEKGAGADAQHQANEQARQSKKVRLM